MTRYTVGGSVTYSCEDHFTLQGSSKRICLVSGVWSGVAPICSSRRFLFITRISIDSSLADLLSLQAT